MGKLIYCGPFYNSSEEGNTLTLTRGSLNNAPNQFQLALISGLMQCEECREMILVNALPIGAWPGKSAEIVLPDKEWKIGNYQAYEIGCINLPFFKQKGREKRLYRLLESIVEDGDSILLYSCYLPFMKAIKRLKKHVQFTLIVTDLPEYYDLGKTSLIRKMMRRIISSEVYQAMERVDSFVLLTEQMRNPLHVGVRPYVVLEGIWNGIPPVPQNCIKKQDAKRIVFYSGTLHYRYGIQLLLDAFEKIERENYELWICGVGEAAKGIEKLSKRDSRVKYFGFCSSARVAELRKRATVLINPRPPEGEYTKYSFPSKTIEYMVSGIPVIAFKLEGMPDEYDYYINYVPGNSAELLKCRIVEICEDQTGKYVEKATLGSQYIQQYKNPTAQAGKVVAMMSDYANIENRK